MKQSLFVFFISIILFSSCDFVTNPIEETSPVGPDTSGGIVIRKVLLEDYTGHKCATCPAAAITANNILAANGDKVVVIAVHPNSSQFNVPETSGSDYLTDFRTAAGIDYDVLFGITGKGLPNGLINRKDYTGTNLNHIINPGSWTTEVALELTKPADAKIEIKNTYNTNSKELVCEVTTTFLTDTLSGGPYKLIVCLTQDSIIATQKYGNSTKKDYVHQHVLRDNLNGSWGVNISSVPVTKNTPIVKTYNYTLPSTYPTTGGASATSCVPEHCEIVAFLYNDVTKEVIQVETKHIIP